MIVNDSMIKGEEVKAIQDNDMELLYNILSSVIRSKVIYGGK